MIRQLSIVLTLVCAAAPALAAPVQLKIATIAPENSSWMKSMRAGGEEIETRTDGRVQLKFYGGGVMGSDAKVLRKMRIGQLHGAAFTPSALIDRYPDINLYGLPLVFNSIEEVAYVRERLDEKLLAGLEEAGLVGFGLTTGGFAKIMSSQPVRVWIKNLLRSKIPDTTRRKAMRLRCLGSMLACILKINPLKVGSSG